MKINGRFRLQYGFWWLFSTQTWLEMVDCPSKVVGDGRMRFSGWDWWMDTKWNDARFEKKKRAFLWMIACWCWHTGDIFSFAVKLQAWRRYPQLHDAVVAARKTDVVEPAVYLKAAGLETFGTPMLLWWRSAAWRRRDPAVTPQPHVIFSGGSCPQPCGFSTYR